jgi:hypothetical protein
VIPVLEIGICIAGLRDLGILGMEEGLHDGASGSTEGETRHGIGSHNLSELREHYWCTMCRKCLKRRQAYNHRNRHGREWGELQDSAWVQAIQAILDQQYGDFLLLFIVPVHLPSFVARSLVSVGSCSFVHPSNRRVGSRAQSTSILTKFTTHQHPIQDQLQDSAYVSNLASQQYSIVASPIKRRGCRFQHRETFLQE